MNLERLWPIITSAVLVIAMGAVGLYRIEALEAKVEKLELRETVVSNNWNKLDRRILKIEWKLEIEPDPGDRFRTDLLENR